MDGLKEVQHVTCYQATRNSTGVQAVSLRIRKDGYILGYSDGTYFVPMGHTANFGKNVDWRTRSIFATRAEAVADYVALEKSRQQKAEKALKQIAA